MEVRPPAVFVTHLSPKKKVASHAYGGSRPFLNEGTNQKSLNRKTEPLTIEQVRELLNKNK